MVNVGLNLRMGHFKSGHFTEWDNVDFEIDDPLDDVRCDNLNDWLNTNADPICTYAELRLCINVINHDGFLIGSFRKIKVKTKDGQKLRWILTD